MNISHGSVSRYQCFDLCPLQYKFRYHDHVKVDLPIAEYFTYGKIVHKIAEVYVDRKGSSPIKEVAKDLMTGKISYEEAKPCPKLSQEYLNKLGIHLRSIENLVEQTGFGGKTEHEFKYDLDRPNERYIVGVIDRLIIKDNKAWIIDYKTTKQGPWRKNKKTILEDLQLQAYALVIHKEFKIAPENINCALLYLEGSELIGARFSQETLERTHQYLLQKYLQIQSMKPDQAVGKIGEWCRRCDYNKICPLYSLT